MSDVKSIIKKIPGITLIKQIFFALLYVLKTKSYKFLLKYPPGHFYSPIPNINDPSIAAYSDQATQELTGGLVLHSESQLHLLDDLSKYYKDLPFPRVPTKNSRYYFENDFFTYFDAITLYAMLRNLSPANIIEIGSGYSSAVMLDTNNLFLSDKIKCTFIEPYPERLLRLLASKDRALHEIIQQPVQAVEVDTFRILNEGDILFVDSSHVSKSGSDVNYILFEILPALNSGVIIHFHDVFWPFEYPKDWLLEGRAWNEAYLLRSFLQYNNSFDIIFFNSYISHNYPEKLKDKMPLCLKDQGGSIWLKKNI